MLVGARRPCSSRASAAPTPAATARGCRRWQAYRCTPPRARCWRWSGPSGCGKTTLLELICGLQTPDAGSIECAPAVLMPQRDLLLPWLSALDNAALALRIAARTARAGTRARASELFAELGLAGFERAHTYELSGGMRQRVAFVRTLLSGKQLLCLDEPFGALDAITRAEMQTWLAGALAARAADGGAGDPRRRGGDRAGRPRGGALAAARPGASRSCEVDLRASARVAPTRDVVALREQALIALARRKGRAMRRSSRDRSTRCRRSLLVALRCSARGSCMWTSGRVNTFVLPAPHEVGVALWDNAGLLSANLALDRRGGGLGILLALLFGFVLGVLIHLLAAPAPRRLPARRRLAGDPDRADRRAARVLVGVRRAAEAVRDRADLLLSGGRHDRRRARVGRSRPAEAAAHARRLALAGVPLRRAAGGAARRDQRRADRAGRRRDRRLHRRDLDGHLGPLPGLGREINADITALQTSRAYAAAVVLFVFAIACFYTLALAERAWRRGRTDREERSVENAPSRPPSPPAHAAAYAGESASASPARSPCSASRARWRWPPAAPSRTSTSAPGDQAVHGDARLVPQRRPRAAVLGDRARRLPRGRPRRAPGRPARNGRTAEAAGGRQGGHGDLL